MKTAIRLINVVLVTSAPIAFVIWQASMTLPWGSQTDRVLFGVMMFLFCVWGTIKAFKHHE